MDDRLAMVRLREGRKPKRYLLPGDLDVTVGDWVVVPEEDEEDIGTIEGRLVPLPVEWEDADLSEVMEIPDPDEVEKAKRQRADREPGAIAKAYDLVRKHNLEIKLIQAHYYHRSNKMRFHFTAENRVDFRELVKDLAHVFRARIDLRQIGVRDAAGMIGGYGLCGEELCCSRFLNGFDPITIRMAKDQYLALNPSKISGCCGRLLCCLKYEHETYLDAKKRFPKLGSAAQYEGRDGKVTGINVLKDSVTLLAETQFLEAPLEEFKRQNPSWRSPSFRPEPSVSPLPTPGEENAELVGLDEGSDSVAEEAAPKRNQAASEDRGKDRTSRRRRRRGRKRNESR